MKFHSKIINDIKSKVVLALTARSLKNNPDKAVDLVKVSLPYWEFLKNDDVDAWDKTIKVNNLWLLTSDNVLIEDTCWTAAAKTGAVNCLESWPADKYLHKGQQIWGDEMSGLGVPKHGGGNVLHSIGPITFEPKVNYLILKWIKESRLDVNQKTVGGVTPLHASAAHGHPAGIEVLMQSGASMHAKTNASATPLEYAVKYGSFETTKKMLSWGGWTIDEPAKIRVLEAALTARLQEPMEMLFLSDGFFNFEKDDEKMALERWRELRERVGRKVSGLEYRNAEKLLAIKKLKN